MTSDPSPSPVDKAVEAYREERRSHWDDVARRGPSGRASSPYHARLETVFKFLVPSARTVLEVGCGEGDLLASLGAEEGFGLDFSPEMVGRARARHPHLTILEGDVHDGIPIDRTFDVVIASDLLNDLWDVQGALERIAEKCHPGTRLVINTFSRLWQGPIGLARSLGLARPVLPQNWLTVDDLRHLLDLAGFEEVRCVPEVLWPFGGPILAPLSNKLLVRTWPLRHLALTNVIVARLKPGVTDRVPEPRVSVVVPARNEAGNVQAILDRIPEMGGGTQIIFVEGHSTDGTWETIEKALASDTRQDTVLLRQPGRGKGDAVRCGFSSSTREVLMILDADLTVPPEDLPRFYAALRSGKGEFINGVRLVYPMEKEAMRFFNLLGNKFFSLVFTYLLGQPVKDTLCGTKVLWRADYERIAANRAYFGDFDPFGDFDLIFGAARLGLKIVDMPVRYRQRTYGSTNIQRWKHGVLLLRMALFAARRIRFV